MTQRLHLRGLHPSGATDGQAPLWSDAADAYVPGDVGSGGGGALAWFNVRDAAYGAVGDGSVDDTAAINLAIAALNAAGAGVLYFPTGIYKTTGALTTIACVSTVFGDGCADSHFRQAATTVRLNSTTAVMFTVGSAAHGTKFSGLNLVNNAATAPTAGAAIQVLGGDGARYDELTISGFWINMDMQDGQEWTMERCFIYSAVKYGMKIQHIDLPDGGDMGITNCQFLAGDYNADAAIRFETAGGLRLTNVKINARTLSHKWVIGLDINVTANTGVLVVGDCSIENTSGSAIRGRESGGSFQAAVINGLEIAYYAPLSAAAIDIDGWADITIDAITALAQSGGSTGPVVKLANVTNGRVGVITNDGFATDYTLTSCTNVAAGVVPTTRQVASGTGLTGGGDLSADRTLAIDTSAETERVQDTVGAMVVQGANITAVYDDTAGTLTIASTASGNLRPVTTESGGTPDFIWDDNNELVMTEAP